MGRSLLGSADAAVFYRNGALMLSIGVQVEEAVHMLAESAEDSPLGQVSRQVYRKLAEGASLSKAMEATGAFPQGDVALMAAGEATGHSEEVLRALAAYRGEEDRVAAKVRSAVAYPCMLLCALSVILAFTVGAILPVFLGVYDAMAGSLAASSFGLVQAGVILGWVALILTLMVTVLSLVALGASRTDGGRAWLLRTAARVPLAKGAFYDLALSRFTAALAVFTAAGQTVDDAVANARATVDHPRLQRRVDGALKLMTDPEDPQGLVQALVGAQVLDGAHGRMLAFGLRAGSIDEVLQAMAAEFMEDAMDGFDSLLDRIEPLLAAFVTVAVGATLIAVMLPLIAMMGAL